MGQREELMVDTFVTLADTLVSDFDVVEFLSLLADRSVVLFGADASGLMLADGAGQLQLTASSSHQMRVLELLELQDDDGPCPAAYRTGRPVECADLQEASDRWPTFAPAALEQGFRSAHALPLRLRDTTIGAFNLLRSTPGSLARDDLVAAQALADVAAIGILHHRAALEAQRLTEQLQGALSSRVVIEQAKGVLAQTLDISVDEAFDRLRRFSRDHNERLSDTALAIVERQLDTTALTSY